MKHTILIVALACCATVYAYGTYVVPPSVTPAPQVRPVRVAPTPVPVVVAPVVVHAPAVTCPHPKRYDGQTRVWVPGRYVDQTMPNGTSVRVWVPGYWQWQ